MQLRAPHAMFNNNQEKFLLRKCLVDAVSRCASFCEFLDISNDVYIIFSYEAFLLASVTFGDQSKRSLQ